MEIDLKYSVYKHAFQNLAYLIAICLSFVNHSEAAEVKLFSYKDSKSISIEGYIDSNTVSQFQKLINTNANVDWVELNSNGGLLLPALRIGQIIRKTGMHTIVYDDDECLSSCALLWLAGEDRHLMTPGKLGFHAAYMTVDGNKIESGVANALIGSYLTELGFSKKTIVFVTAAAPSRINFISNYGKEVHDIEFTAYDPVESEENEKKDTQAVDPPTVFPPSSGLPSYLPIQLSQNGENWVEVGNNYFLDINSLSHIDDLNGNYSSLWILYDNKEKNSETLYAMSEIYLFCSSRTFRIKSRIIADVNNKRQYQRVEPVKQSVYPGSIYYRLTSLVCK